MRGFGCDYAQIKIQIEQIEPGWMTKARASTFNHITARCVSSTSPDWKKIKSVFFNLQGGVCAYCERELDGASKRSFDLEHFRPKGKLQKCKKFPSFDLPSSVMDTGYYWLAHEPKNYLVACIQCNQHHKGSKFPVRGARPKPGTSIDRIVETEREQFVNTLYQTEGFLRSLFRYKGPFLLPLKSQSSFITERARIIIAELDLNRPDLLKARSRHLKRLYDHAKQMINNGYRPRSASFDLLIQPHWDFYSCLLEFRDWIVDDFGAAQEFYRNSKVEKLAYPVLKRIQ